MHPTKNDLPEATRAKMCELLNGHLADATDLVRRAGSSYRVTQSSRPPTRTLT